MSDDIDLTSADDLIPFPVLDGPSDVSRRKFELWQNTSGNSLLWDITLVAADGRRFPASRLELASWSEYFCKIFQGDYAETNQTVLSLPEDVGGDALELLLHGIYLQEILFNKDNVEDVLRISDRLQVIPVKDACAIWLEKEMDAFNVLEILSLADKYTCTQLDSLARDFLRHHFEKVVQFDGQLPNRVGLTSLSQTALVQILTDDNLELSSEMPVFRAIKQWRAGQPASSPGLLFNLLMMVRLEHLQGDALHQLLQDKLIRADVQCSQLVAHAALQIAGTATDHFPCRPVRSFAQVQIQNTLMVRVWKVCNWTEVHDRMKEGERIYSDKFPIANVTGTWKFDFFPKGTAGADGWMSLYFKYADQFSDNQQIGFGFKLHVINFQFPSQTLTKVYEKSQCTFSAESPGWGHQKMALIAAVNDPQGGFIIDDTIYIGISKTES